MYALGHAPFIYLHCGHYAKAKAVKDELLALADEKGALFWRPHEMVYQGALCAITGQAADAVRIIPSGLAEWRSMGSTCAIPHWLAYLSRAYAELGKKDEGLRCFDEATTAIEATGERWYEAELQRVAGEIAMLSPDPDATKAEAHFECALTVARQQQAKSWELRASMSLARLWRDQGKPQQARELLAPVYGWFTEGFDTRDLKEAKALLEELAA